MPQVEILLAENIPGLGAEADIVKVRPGFARNFLVPQGKGFLVTPATLRKINMLKAKRAEREAAELNQAQEIARKINKLKLTLTLETGKTGKSFGSITTSDLAARIKAELGGLEIDRHRIVLEQPIKNTGHFEIPIKLHPEVTAKLDLTVKSNVEEEAAEPAGQMPDVGANPEEKKPARSRAKTKPK